MKSKKRGPPTKEVRAQLCTMINVHLLNEFKRTVKRNDITLKTAVEWSLQRYIDEAQ